jgi:hypothetical protein
MRKQSVLTVAFLLLFVGYFCAANLFSHTHIVNGNKIVHSHPHQKGHAHTDSELQLIKYLTSFSFIEYSQPSLRIVNILLSVLDYCYFENYNNQLFPDYFNKGPPFLFR